MTGNGGSVGKSGCGLLAISLPHPDRHRLFIKQGSEMKIIQESKSIRDLRFKHSAEFKDSVYIVTVSAVILLLLTSGVI